MTHLASVTLKVVTCVTVLLLIRLADRVDARPDTQRDGDGFLAAVSSSRTSPRYFAVTGQNPYNPEANLIYRRLS